MRTVVVTRNGNPEVLRVQERPDPRPGPGEVLIAVRAAGVNFAAAEIARQAGVEVIGAAAPVKHDAIRAHGVTHPIDSRAGDLKRRVLELTAGEGVDVAIDAAGPKGFRTSYGLLRPGGRLVMIGYYAAADRGLRATLSLVRSVAAWPLATMPWWTLVTLLRQNRAVAGLDLLAWWDCERDGAATHGALLPRLSGPVLRLLADDALRPVVRDRSTGRRVSVPCGAVPQRTATGTSQGRPGVR